MDRWVKGALAVALVAAVGISSCSRQGRGPQPGETVTPALSGGTGWAAGEPAGLAVRLQARGPEDGKPRSLDFISGVSANPVATVTFFDGEQALGPPAEVALSHRC